MTSIQKTDANPTYDIDVSSDGGRVWVTGYDGSSIGRFNKRAGIDVHTTATQQMAGEGECLYCTHGAAGYNEWVVFCAKIKEHYDIDVPLDLIKFDADPKVATRCSI